MFRYGAAEVDCTLAITLDPKYIKAYHRRGTARLALKRYNEAKEDFENVLKLEPFNKAAQQELIKIEKELESMTLVFAVDKPAEKRSDKPLKRILIQEINVDVDKKLEAARNEIKSKVKLNENDEKLFSLNEKVEKVVVEEEIKVKTVEKKKVEAKNIVKVIPPAATNGFQFRKDWQLLGNSIDDLTTYFKVKVLFCLLVLLKFYFIFLNYKQILPEKYQNLFMNGLESDILSKILIIFKNFVLR